MFWRFSMVVKNYGVKGCALFIYAPCMEVSACVTRLVCGENLIMLDPL
jgi:hypothetical protein